MILLLRIRLTPTFGFRVQVALLFTVLLYAAPTLAQQGEPDDSTAHKQASQLFSPDEDENERKFEAEEVKGPKFSIFKDNYFATGTSIGSGNGIQKTNSDVKFQISLKIRLTKLKILWNSYLFLAYTQKSFWDVYRPSLPFRENNYNPALQLRKSFYTKKGKVRAYSVLEFEHESNGLDSVVSRSWNRLSATHMELGKRFSWGAKIWWPIGIDKNLDETRYGENPQLIRYVGYGEAIAYWKPFHHAKVIVDGTLRKGTGPLNYFSLVTNFRFKPKHWGTYLLLQDFIGYGENLLEYRMFTHKIRVGIVVTPMDLIFR